MSTESTAWSASCGCRIHILGQYIQRALLNQNRCFLCLSFSFSGLFASLTYSGYLVYEKLR